MADIIPFKAFRPSRDKVHLVASRSYISYKPKELKRKLDENPFTFLHILNPEYNRRKTTKANSAARFSQVRTQFLNFVEQDILIQDHQESYYLYRQIKNGHAYIGIIGCASVSDYDNDIIKKHEATLSMRENMFKNYLRATEINAEPVCFTYPNHHEIDQISQRVLAERPEYDFTTTNRVRHTFWLIDDKDAVNQIQKAFASIDSIYIADGHHRSASSALMGRELQQKNKNHNGKELYNYFMGIFIPETELQIFEFNRLVKNMNGLSSEEFISALKEEFDVQTIETNDFAPQQTHEIGMYMESKWYCLRPKETILTNKSIVDELDVSILTEHVLTPILGIEDIRNDDRLYFKGGLEGSKALKQEVDNGKAKVAFAHFPVSMKALKDIADAGFIMPPKSTWIEPKLRSGLTVFSTNEND